MNCLKRSRMMIAVGIFAVVATAHSSTASAAGTAPSIWQTILGPTFSIKAGTRRLLFAEPNIELENPRGFDVASEVYRDGSLTGSTSTLLNLSLENPLEENGIAKRVWEIHYDRKDFNGLQLSTVMLGTGIAASPRQKWAWGGRIAAGLAVGLSSSDTYFDSAIHPGIDAWVTAGAQLKVVSIDVMFRARQSLSQTLDERSAAPRTTLAGLSIGVVF